jgi:hypothetical protein
MAYDRQWLRDQLAKHLRDSTLGDQADVFIDLGAKQLSVVLETPENEESQTWNIGAYPYVIPDGINRIRVINHRNGQYDVALKSVPLHRIGIYTEGGYPQVYAIKGAALSIGPPVTGEYEVVYWRDVELAGDAGATDPTLERYPQAWLDSVLAQAYAWKQDGEMSSYYEQRLMSTAETINRKSRQINQGDAPVQRAS